jgi:hypothetical protein
MTARGSEQIAVRAALWVAIALSVGAPAAVCGGEPIQFSNSKSVSSSPQRGQLTKQVEQTIPGRTLSLGGEMMMPGVASQAVDPKEEKRQKQAAFDKKNWILDKDQIDEDRAADEAFGIRSEEEFEKDGEESNFWLSPMRDDRSRSHDGLQSAMSRGSGQARGGTGQRPAPIRPSEAKDLDKGASKSSGPPGSAQAGRLASELGMRSIFSPGGSGGPSVGESAFSFRDLSGANGIGDGERATRGPLVGLGAVPSRGGGFDNLAPPGPALNAAGSGQSSYGFSDSQARSSSAFSQDRGFWSGRNPGGNLGSLGVGESLLPRSDGSSPLLAPQQQSEQRRSFRELEKPKFPGQ